ncbi:hypothetical protein [Sulfuricurvum sp.]|uniref:hypothetical protein n=1 Tax=Sulfuricurvum sp. TaxID=2025608 RepID=UPI003569B28A
MSYCRMQNTYHDLRDVEEHINDDDMSKDELSARENIISLCKRIIDNAVPADELNNNATKKKELEDEYDLLMHEKSGKTEAQQKEIEKRMCQIEEELNDITGE